MATKLNRVAVMDRFRQLVELTSTDLDLSVVLGPPRNPQQGKLLVIGDVTGDMTVAHLTAGRKVYDDRFSVEVLSIAWDSGAEDHSRCDADCEAITEHVRDLIADRPHLELQPGASGMDGLVAATVAQVDGPNRWWNPEGAGTAMRLTVDFHVRID